MYAPVLLELRSSRFVARILADARFLTRTWGRGLWYARTCLQAPPSSARRDARGPLRSFVVELRDPSATRHLSIRRYMFLGTLAFSEYTLSELPSILGGQW